MSSFEEPILPPEGEGHGNRYESADLDIEELRVYLVDTKFENEEAVDEVLINQYGLFRNDNIDQIKMNMTREMDARLFQPGYTTEEREGMTDKPLSGIDPQAVLRVNLKTLDGKDLDLRIFRVYNRNMQFRFEYILNPVEKEF